jgi:hypothetical protein
MRATAARAAGPVGGLALAAALAALLSLAATVAPARGAPEPAVVALLADNRLIKVQADSGLVSGVLALAAAPAAGTFRPPGHYLAQSRDGRMLYALVPDQPPGANRLAVVRASDFRQVASYPLARGAARYQSLAVGPVSGRVYLFGSRPGEAVVSVLDPGDGAILHTWPVKSLADWKPKGPVSGAFFIYQGAAAPDERTLYYSYYGGRLDLAGVDAIRLTANGVAPCRPTRPNGACMLGWAGFALYRDGILAISPNETGSGEVFDLDAAGRARRTLNLRLGPGFLMDFALDRAAGTLYAVGSCGYVGGLSALDLATGVARVLAPPDPPGRPPAHAPCGQRLALLPGGLLVVGQVPNALVPFAGRPGALLFLDAATGRAVRRVAAPEAPIDVLALPAR